MLKKVLYILLSVIVITPTFISKPLSLKGYATEITIYLDSNSSNAKTELVKSVYVGLKNIKGEECVVKNLSVNTILADFNAEVIFIEEVNGIVSYYGYSKKLPYMVKLYDKKINLHIAVNKNSIKIGTPIIFGGY